MALNLIFKGFWKNVWFSSKIKLRQLRPWVFYNLSMDFITGLPKSEGKSIIMVVVDRITKYAHFCVLSHPFKVSKVANTFMETIQKLNGNPMLGYSDT